MASKSFLGRGLSFPLAVEPKTGKIAMVEHEEDIKQAIEIIIRTYKGERVMLSDFGTTVDDYTFDVTSISRVDSIINDLEQELLIWEPRIIDLKITAENNYGTKAALMLNIDYTVRSTNNQYNMVFPFYMLEGDGK